MPTEAQNRGAYDRSEDRRLREELDEPFARTEGIPEQSEKCLKFAGNITISEIQ